MERNLVTISQAARYLGVNIMTLRRWDEEGKLKPIKTFGKHRRYDINDLEYYLYHKDDDNVNIPKNPNKAICYVRVSSSDQKEDLERHPSAFSGGQRQRISIARALLMEPLLKLIALELRLFHLINLYLVLI